MSESDEPAIPPRKPAATASTLDRAPISRRAGTPLPYLPRLPGALGSEDPLPQIPDDRASPSATPPPLDLAGARRRRSLLTTPSTPEMPPEPEREPPQRVDLRAAAAAERATGAVELPTKPIFLDEVEATAIYTAPVGTEPPPPEPSSPHALDDEEAEKAATLSAWTLALAGVILVGLLAIAWLAFALLSQPAALGPDPRNVPALQAIPAEDTPADVQPEAPVEVPPPAPKPAPPATTPAPPPPAIEEPPAPVQPAATDKKSERKQRRRKRRERKSEPAAPAKPTETAPAEPESPWGALPPGRP
ncbi:MAG: hypothetical protein AB8H79_16080 [Myxococcota bacterium]